MKPGDGPDPRHTLKGILFKLASVVVFVGMASCIKAAGQLPAGQIVFFRSFFATIPIIVFFAWRGQLMTSMKTKRPLSHVARCSFGVIGMGCGFFALTRLPLPEAITLGYAQPLFVVIFSALIIGETVRVYRWSAVVVGMVGVIIVSWPKLSLFRTPELLGDAEMMGVIVALAGATIGSIASLMVRSLVHTDRTSTIVLWFSLTASVAGLLTLPFGWSPLTVTQAALLIAAGFCGGVGQLLVTQAYRYAEASTVAPFEYTSLLLGLLIGYFLFAEPPTIHMIVGGTIVVGAGIFIILREHQLNLQRGAARRATPPG